MKSLFEKILLVCLIICTATAKAQSDDPLDKYDVVWLSPSVSEKDSFYRQHPSPQSPRLPNTLNPRPFHRFDDPAERLGC